MRRMYNSIFISLCIYSLISFTTQAFAQETNLELKNPEEESMPINDTDSVKTEKNVAEQEKTGEKEEQEEEETAANEEEENSEEEEKEKKAFLEKPAHPYLAIGANVGRMGYKFFQENSQEYNFFAFYSVSKKIFIHAEFGLGNEKVDYPHLTYNTKSSYLQIAFQYSFFKESHEWDKDRIYISPFVQVHAGNISEARIHVENQSGFTVEDIIASRNFIKSSVGARFNVEMEILPKILLSWHGQAALLIAANKFPEIKPQFIAGYGNADKNVNFQFGVNIAYYFGR